MFYSIRRGLVSRLRPHVIRSSSVLLPVLALAFIMVAAFSFNSTSSAGKNPYINNAQRHHALSASSAQKSSPAKNSKSTSLTTSPARPAMSMSSLESPPVTSPSFSPNSYTSSPSPSSITGGMGGGDATSGSSSTTAGTGASTTGSTGTSSSGDQSNPAQTTVTLPGVCLDALGKQVACTDPTAVTVN